MVFDRLCAARFAGRSRPEIAPSAVRCILRDGTPIMIRPIVPEDKAVLQQGIAQLSYSSRYLRFMNAVHELPAWQLRYLTEIDYRDHMAWVAFDVSGPEALGVGVARYIRSREEFGKAEVAVTVVDSHQGRGLGTLLLAALVQTAVENGIETFVAYVLAQNAPVMRMARDRDATFQSEGGGLFRIEVPVPAYTGFKSNTGVPS